MSTTQSLPFDDLGLDHIGWYVNDLSAARDHYVDTLGFHVYAETGADGAEARSVGVGVGRIRFVLTEAPGGDHPGDAYVDRHGDGVADIAMRVTDATVAFQETVRRGARPVQAPREQDGFVVSSVMGFGDVVHSFVQRPAGVDVRALPGLRPQDVPERNDLGLGRVDHLAVCLEPGELDDTAEFYREVFGFEIIFTERVVVGSQAVSTKVVQSPSREVTLTLIEPDRSGSTGHLDEFLKAHGGAGVQHIAFDTEGIVDSIAEATARGVEFLSAPDTYYEILPQRLAPARYQVGELRPWNVLVDEDHDGQLYQIFTRSVHPRETIFLEFIERMGARSFGSGNIAALYEAVELERGRDPRHDQAADSGDHTEARG